MWKTLAPAALLLPMLAQAAPAHLVQDTDPTPVPGSSVMTAVAAGEGPGGAVFFLVQKSAPHENWNTQLWRCDASGQNPRLLRDRLVHASDLVVFDRRLFFNGDDGIHGGEPWTSDGTAEGTRMIADVVPGGLGSYPYYWVALGPAVYFVNHAGAGGTLWKTDLAASAAAPVFAVPSEDGGPSRVSSIVRSGDSLCGWFDDGIHGFEPWSTDGTAEGSRLLADIYPGGNGSLVADMVDLDGVVLFGANEPDVGITLWRAVPAQGNATRLHAVAPSSMRRLGSRVYFSGFEPATGSEPWQTDGTPEGTRLVADIVPGPQESQPSGFRAAGATVYFSPHVPGLGHELWKVLPEGGAALVKDIWPGPEYGLPTWLNDARALGDRLLFRADDGVHGAELWSTDGTAEGTVLVRDVKPGPAKGVESSWSVGGFRVVSGNLYFDGDDGVIGLEPWRSDGTPEGTVPVGDLNPVMGTASGNVHGLVAGGSAAYFLAARSDVWGTDGTSAGTRRLATDAVGPLAAAGDRVVFSANDAEHGPALWASDLDGNTVAPLGLPAGPQPFHIEMMGSVGGRALALGLVNDACGVWGTDGTEEGTASLGIYAWCYGWMKTAPGGVSVLALSDGVTGFEPWATDGTIQGTRLLADLVPGPDSSGPFNFTASGQTISFFAFDPSGAETLWVSDGTTEGTREITGFDQWSNTDNTVAIVGGAVFFADYRTPSFGLWRTEGTGVALVAQIAHASPSAFFGVGDLLYFTVRRADPDGVVHELWRSDGTTMGTFPLASFPHPQPPVFLGEVEGVVLFSASQGSGPFPGAHGLWRSDGSAAGTRQVQDITAGPVVTLGTQAYFPADDGLVGMELWSARTSILAGNATRALEELRAELDAAGLPPGIARSLRAKLAPGRSGSLQAFLRELDALPAKVLDRSAAESLRGFAVEILELLSAP